MYNAFIKAAKVAYNNYVSNKPSSLAQSVEHLTVNQGVVGSSPTGGAIEIKVYEEMFISTRFLSIWLHGQAVKTSPFHGGNTGSIPVGVIAL